MHYDKAMFEQVFQLITAVSHQIVKIDFGEMEDWVNKLMGPKALTDDISKANMHQLNHVMRQFAEMRQTLIDHGIPVRDISHYRESVDIDPGSNTVDVPNPQGRL